MDHPYGKMRVKLQVTAEEEGQCSTPKRCVHTICKMRNIHMTVELSLSLSLHADELLRNQTNFEERIPRHSIALEEHTNKQTN